jgi:TetR/AcrR family fatty acid metabolism transcriptional regulator
MDKKELIYKAAVKIFSQNGYDSTKIQMIAKEAGIAVGTVYLYFKSKEEILEFIICREHQKRIDFIERHSADDKYAIEKIRDYLQYHLDTMLDNYDESIVVLQELAFTDVKLDENTKTVIRNLQGKICQLIIEAQQQGSVRRSNPHFLMLTLLSSIRGFMNSIIHMAEGGDGCRQLKLQAICFLIDGMTI